MPFQRVRGVVLHELKRLLVVVRLAHLRLARDHLRVWRWEHRAVDGRVRQQASIQHVHDRNRAVWLKLEDGALEDLDLEARHDERVRDRVAERAHAATTAEVVPERIIDDAVARLREQSGIGLFGKRLSWLAVKRSRPAASDSTAADEGDGPHVLPRRRLGGSSCRLVSVVPSQAYHRLAASASLCQRDRGTRVARSAREARKTGERMFARAAPGTAWRRCPAARYSSASASAHQRADGMEL